ncbi:flavodoxin [Thomasclavelia sp.]
MKILIAYFSYTGHTAEIARKIQEQTGGTLFEIKPAEPYSDDYDTTERQGRKETQRGHRPLLADMPADLTSYDVILLGTPNWFNTIAPPVASFLESSNLFDKKIALFCTNGGGGLGHTIADIKTLCSEAEIIDSINIYEDGGAGAEKKIADWLKQIGLKQ